MKDIKYISGQRGVGLMAAFDLPTPGARDDLILECVKAGLILLGCADRSVRIIPSYVVEEHDIDIALGIIDKAAKDVQRKGFTHKGRICKFAICGHHVT